LEAVQSETDQARVERVRQENEGASMGNGGGAVDHGFGFTKPVMRWRDEEGKEHVLGSGGGGDDGEDSSEGSKEILAAEEAKRTSAAEEQPEQIGGGP
jgi:hypothetical protein